MKRVNVIFLTGGLMILSAYVGSFITMHEDDKLYNKLNSICTDSMNQCSSFVTEASNDLLNCVGIVHKLKNTCGTKCDAICMPPPSEK